MYKEIAIWMTVVFCNASCQQPAAKPTERAAKFTAEAEAAWSAHAAIIKDEIEANPRHPWAGWYFHGDGMSVNASLGLAPRSGFVFRWSGCIGVYDRNYGDVQLAPDGSIILSPTFENDRRGLQGVGLELIAVPWGQRRYLVPVDEVARFCNAVNGGSEPRNERFGFFFLHDGDHEKPATGQPSLPEEYQGLLLGAPIVAEIVAVEPARMEEGVAGIRFQRTKATLKFAESGRLASGMTLQIAEPSDYQCMGKAEVQSVGDDTAEVLITQPVNDRFPPLPPAVGWKLTTGSRPPPMPPFMKTPK